MANPTMTLIASVTVGSGGASSIDFTSIPATYADLCVKISYRSSGSTTTAVLTSIYNNDGGNNYKNLFLYGTGSGAGSGNYNPNNSNYFGYGNIATYTTNTFTNTEIYIPNYAGSNQKSTSGDNVAENNATASQLTFSANLWTGTTAINRITFGIYLDNFAQYSTAYLYGIKNS